MSRKSHNSILFLTTLGVYLGLILVGATPQVLAQAATTKQFTIREEVSISDDLDKQPDDNAAAATAVEVSLRNGADNVVLVDHPFLFFLVHRPTSTVLFSGRVVSAR